MKKRLNEIASVLTELSVKYSIPELEQAAEILTEKAAELPDEPEQLPLGETNNDEQTPEDGGTGGDHPTKRPGNP